MESEKHVDRLLTLDAMRGLAAIVVMLGHSTRVLDRSGWLAVDFFFMLSGFVISRSYARKLAAGMPFFQFAKLRFARLYPMYAIGSLIGLAARFAFPSWYPLTPGGLVTTVLFNGLLLPSPASENLFPINPPGWSLFFELAINLVFAAVMVRARILTLVVVAALSAAGLMAISWHYTGLSGVGWSRATFLPGFVRTLFSFVSGVVISRLHARRARTTGWSPVTMLVLTALLLVSVSGAARAAYDSLVVIVASPLLVWLGASYDPPKPLQKLSAALGEISFPLYAVHLPLFLWFDFMAMGFHREIGAWKTGWKLAFLLFIIPISWLLAEHVDAPLRKWLSARIRVAAR